MANLRIYTDGGARGNPGLSASAFVVVLNGKVIYKDAKFLGISTNNEAEYAGVLMGLEWLSSNKHLLNKTSPTFCLDSELVTRQIIGAYKVKSQNLFPCAKRVKDLLKKLETKVNFISISREENRLADALLNAKIDEKSG
jgi:ribonuclease HI